MTRFLTCFIAASSLLALPGHAAIIDFDSLNLADFEPIPSGYGSTAEIAVFYQTLGSAPNLRFVNSNYGDLSQVAITAQHFALAEIRFAANNAGQMIKLDSFDLGSAATNPSNNLRILDGNGVTLLDYGTVPVPNSAGHITFTPGIASQTLVLQFGNDERIGIDNIELSVIAEPGSCVLLVAGLALLVARRRSEVAPD